MPVFSIEAPDGTKLTFDGPPPSPSDLRELADHYEQQNARAANAKNIAAAKAIPVAPDSETAAGYAGGVKAGLAETGQDIKRGASEIGRAAAQDVTGLPKMVGGLLLPLALGNPQSGDDQYQESLHTTPFPADPVGAGAAVQGVKKAANAKGGIVAKLIGPDSVPSQILAAAAQHPVYAAAAIAGGMEGLGGALDAASGIAAKSGAAGVSDALAANAKSARFFADPADVASMPGKVAAKISELRKGAATPGVPSATVAAKGADAFASKPPAVIEPPATSAAPVPAGDPALPAAPVQGAKPTIPEANRVGPINLDRMNLTDVEKAKVTEAAQAAGLTTPRPQSNAETVAQAKSLGVTLDTLRRREPNGVPPEGVNGAAYQHAVRELHAQTAQQAAGLEEVYKAQPTAENLEALTTANENLSLAAKHDAAFATEHGRGLQARQIQSDPFVAAAEGDLFRQPVGATTAAVFKTRGPRVLSSNKIFTAEEVAAAQSRIAARAPASVKDFAKQFLTEEHGYIDPEALKDYVIVAGGYIEAGLRRFPELAARMKADHPDLTPGDLQAIWAAARGEIQSRTGAAQSPKLKSDVFVDQYAQRHGRDNAAGFVHDLMAHTGDTRLLDQVLSGKALTPEESRVVRAAEVNNSRDSGKPGALSPGMQALKDARDFVANEKAQASPGKSTQRINASTPTQNQIAMRHFAQRLTPAGAQELRARLKDPSGRETIFNKIADGSKLTQDEARRFGLAYTTVKQPRPQGARSPLSETLTQVVKHTQDVTIAEQQKAALLDWSMRKANVRNEVLKTLDPARVPAFTQAAASLKDGDFHGLRRVMNSFSHDKSTPIEKAFNVVNSARSLVAGGDVSYVGRQGGMLALANPRLAAKSLGSLVQALKSERTALKIDLDIRTRPNAELYRKYNLALTTLDDTGYSAASLSKREENYANSIVENLPGGQFYRATERANATFLNRLRADTFDMFVHQGKRAGKSLGDADYKAMADFVNDASGRASLGEAGNKAAALLNTAFFSPRFTASRFRIATGAPLLNGGSAFTRGLIARTYLQYATAAATMITLGHMAGAKVDLDPRSSAFLKLQFGPVTVDLLSGLGQTTTFLSRMATNQTVTQRGQVKTLDGKGMNGTRLDVAVRFARSKSSPAAGTILDLLAGKDYLGKPITAFGTKGGNYLDGEVQKNAIQMSLPDVVAAAKDQGIPTASAVAALNLLGVGVNYRGASR